jgi:nucleoside-diphosphate-sugar epimerase
MRVVVTGATGNVGTSVVRAPAADPQVDEIVGVARRLPSWRPPRTRWISADVERDDLAALVANAGAGALVHASSVGVYSPGPKDRRVDESWPREGVASSFYGGTRPPRSGRSTPGRAARCGSASCSRASAAGSDGRVRRPRPARLPAQSCRTASRSSRQARRVTK